MSDLDNIYPLIVPADYHVKGTWDLPHHILPSRSFILTWVTFGSATAMTYLTEQQFRDLTDNHNDWQQKSFENLRRSVGTNENFFTHSKLSNDGRRLIFLAFINVDGIGSSRILLTEELARAFPNGYQLAFPDRSCGLVISKDINDKELIEVKKMIKSMYKNATTAMSGELHSIKDFVLPANWTKPLDSDFAQTFTNEITKLTSL